MEKSMNKVIAAIAALSILISGCSTFAPKTQTVSAVCSEPDAALQINGQMFQGRAQVEAKKNKTVSIMCTKVGYFPAQKTIDYSLSGTGVADAIGTALLLLPGIGLFTAGAWKLDETDVSLPMIKSEK
jgi:outer membrane murein-binding lipoprotein Lpp